MDVCDVAAGKLQRGRGRDSLSGQVNYGQGRAARQEAHHLLPGWRASTYPVGSIPARQRCLLCRLLAYSMDVKVGGDASITNAARADAPTLPTLSTAYTAEGSRQAANQGWSKRGMTGPEEVMAQQRTTDGQAGTQRTGKEVVPISQVGQPSGGGAGCKGICSRSRWRGCPWVAPCQPADRRFNTAISRCKQALQRPATQPAGGPSRRLPACLPAHPQKKLEASSLEAKPTTVELYWRTASGTSAAAVGPGAAVVKRGN